MCVGMWVRVEARGFVNRCLHLTEMGEMAYGGGGVDSELASRFTLFQHYQHSSFSLCYSSFAEFPKHLFSRYSLIFTLFVSVSLPRLHSPRAIIYIFDLFSEVWT